MAKVIKFHVLASNGEPAYGSGTGHLNSKNRPWQRRADGVWERFGWTVQETFPETTLPWTIANHGTLSRRSHGIFEGFRRFKTAGAAMMSVTGDRTVFATSPWRNYEKSADNT